MNEQTTDEPIRYALWVHERARRDIDAIFVWLSENVLPETAQEWRNGIIPVFVNRKMGKGGKYWFSPTSLRNFKEDEDRQKRRAMWEKNVATRRAGLVEREVYKQRHKPCVYKKPIPPGWITVREAADLLDIGRSALYHLIKHSEIAAEHFTGRCFAKHRPWFISRTSLEEYIQTEFYQRKHKEGKEAAQKMIGISPSAADTPVPNEQSRRDFPELAPAYSYDELMRNRERVTSLIDSPALW